MAFNERLKELRIRKDMSQSELADALNISKSAISMYERGERNPDFETLELISDFVSKLQEAVRDVEEKTEENNSSKDLTN